MIGQYTDSEFTEMLLRKASNIIIRNGVKQATIPYGRSTLNFYIQHSDNSWTNYDCKTVQTPFNIFTN
jgi:hypothetical protein